MAAGGEFFVDEECFEFDYLFIIFEHCQSDALT